MRADRFKPGNDACCFNDYVVKNLIDNPQHTKKRYLLGVGECPEFSIAGQQCPTPNRGKGVGEGVGERKLGVCPTNMLRNRYLVLRKLFNTQAARDYADTYKTVLE